MNQIGTPLPALSPQGGERVAEGRERGGSWVASIRFCARIGTMNRCASQRRGPDRGSATRSLLGSWRGEGSWKASFRFCPRIGAMNRPGPPATISPTGGEREGGRGQVDG